jgi:hypothetical protein
MLITPVGGGNAVQIFPTVLDRLSAGLNADERRRIESYQFFFVTCVSPSSTVKFRGNPFPHEGSFRILFIEWKFFSDLRGKPDELGAVLLHEVGHTLNPAPAGRNTEEEYYADDYARHCGFGGPLRRNLEGCLRNHLVGFERDGVKERICRITPGGPLNLNLVAPRSIGGPIVR